MNHKFGELAKSLARSVTLVLFCLAAVVDSRPQHMPVTSDVARSCCCLTLTHCSVVQGDLMCCQKTPRQSPT